MRLAVVLLICITASPAEDAQNVLVWTPRSVMPDSLRTKKARFFHSIPLASLRLTSAERRALESELGPGRIFEDRVYRTSLLPSTAVTGIPLLWDSGFTGRSQSVAIIDTGVNPNHPSFLGVNIVQRVFLNSGKDHPCFGDDPSTGNDLQGHGTRTASILASQAIPQFPAYFGAARGIATLYSMKAGFRARPGSACPVADGVLLASDILAAIEFIANQTDAKVVNLSLGSNTDADDDPLARIFDYFADRFGLTIVFAAGNAGTAGPIQTPGVSYNGITVANIDDKGTEDKRDDTIHSSSTRGPTVGLRNKPDIAAPGTRIFAAEFNSAGFSNATGTSAAAPLVAGAAALLRDAGVADPLSVKALLLNSADGDGLWLRDWGWGSLNAAAAFDNQRNLLRGSIGPRGSRFFRIAPDGPLRATLVWNRHPDVSSPNARSPLNELALTAYRRDGSVAAQSDSPRDNVERIRLDAGDYVLRVDSPATSPAEDFALAVDRAGMFPAEGPKWELRCTMPSSVSPNSTFTANCTAWNTGGLDLFRATGSLLVPPGFSGGGPQSFGTLAPGQSRALQWTIGTPASAGSFPLTLSGTAASYGSLNVDATATPPRLEVDGSPLALDPAVVTLTPSSGPTPVRISGSAANAALQAGAPWYRLSPAVNGSFTISLTDAARSLAEGRYESQYIATAGGLTVRGTVVLSVSAPMPAIEFARMTRHASMVPGCPPPQELSSVADAIMPSYWFVVRGVTASDRVTVRWIAPGGSIVASTDFPSVVSASCFVATLDVRRVDPARRFGEWRVEAFVNGIRQSNTSFSVNPALELTSSDCADARPTPARIPVCPQFGGGASTQGRRTEFEFERPGGEVDGTAEGSSVVYSPNVAASGTWRVRVFVDGALAGTVEIPVSTPFSLKSADVSGSRLNFAVHETPPDTKGRLDFVNPAGTVVETLVLESAEGSVEIPELSDPGRWQIRLFWSDVLLTTLPVDRFPARVIEQGITAESHCSTKTASMFSTLDPAARYWIRLEGEARPSIEFWQAGVLRARAGFEPVAVGNGNCLAAALPVAGSLGARNPGAWEARALLNGIEVARSTFEIRRAAAAPEPARTAPLVGSLPIQILRAETVPVP